MSYFLYKLEFDSPVHFGNAEQGGKLEQVGMDYPSDTLFSAICSELALQHETETLNWFITSVKEEKIVFSNLFPFLKKADQEDFLYLPKPVLSAPQDNSEKRLSLEELKAAATNRKKQKKINYIRCGKLNDYFTSLRTGSRFEDNMEFGTVSLTQRVARREDPPLPYYVAKYVFKDGAGMYLVASFSEEKAGSRFKDILDLLGLSGIGGKRSSGFGKFHIAYSAQLNENSHGDAGVLFHLLEDRTALWQMNVSSVLPFIEDLEQVKEGQYKLQKRSGFVTAVNGEAEMKKNSLYLIAAGSCFKKRLAGRLVALGNTGSHDVLRCGKGLYVGLALS